MPARDAYGFRDPSNQRLRTRTATTRKARGHLDPVKFGEPPSRAHPTQVAGLPHGHLKWTVPPRQSPAHADLITFVEQAYSTDDPVRPSTRQRHRRRPPYWSSSWPTGRTFARSIPDRGEEYFARFADRHAALLAMQAAGTDFFHIVTGPDGAILGRVNLVKIADGRAELGYRIAEAATGRGLATWAAGEACRLATDRYRLRLLTAITTLDNTASRTVLTRTGFTAVREVEINGQPGLGFELTLN